MLKEVLFANNRAGVKPWLGRVLVACWIGFGISAHAETNCSCSGSRAVALRERSPVYAEASMTSSVRGYLLREMEVCVVGERAGYAIIDFHCLELASPSSHPPDDQLQSVGYVRLTDIESSSEGKGFLSWLKNLYHYIGNRGVIEGPVIPTRQVQQLLKDQKSPAEPAK